MRRKCVMPVGSLHGWTLDRTVRRVAQGSCGAQLSKCLPENVRVGSAFYCTHLPRSSIKAAWAITMRQVDHARVPGIDQWASPSNTDTLDKYDPTIGGVTCNEGRLQKNSSARRSSSFGNLAPARAGIARDLGVGANLLGRWCREQEGRSVPTRSGSSETVSTQEFDSMRRELTKVKTERDILKKRLSTSRPTPSEVPLYRTASHDLADTNDVPYSWRFDERFLRLVRASRKSSSASQRGTSSANPRKLCGQ